MKILIVDDEPLVRRALVRVFSHSGWSVEEAAEGRQGIEKWVAFRPEVVLLDVLMPGLSGPQVLEEISPEIRGGSKVILMSAFLGENLGARSEAEPTQNWEEFLNLRVDGFLPKPFEDIFAIVDRVTGILEKKDGSNK